MNDRFEALYSGFAYRYHKAVADEAGLPWASPVWFASVDLREFFWVSSPDARHSRNLAVRPSRRSRKMRLADAAWR